MANGRVLQALLVGLLISLQLIDLVAREVNGKVPVANSVDSYSSSSQPSTNSEGTSSSSVVTTAEISHGNPSVNPAEANRGDEHLQNTTATNDFVRFNLSTDANTTMTEISTTTNATAPGLLKSEKVGIGVGVSFFLIVMGIFCFLMFRPPTAVKSSPQGEEAKLDKSNEQEGEKQEDKGTE